jgi:hypothetical protein
MVTEKREFPSAGLVGRAPRLPPLGLALGFSALPKPNPKSSGRGASALHWQRKLLILIKFEKVQHVTFAVDQYRAAVVDNAFQITG